MSSNDLAPQPPDCKRETLDYVTTGCAKVPVTKAYRRLPDGTVEKIAASRARMFEFERPLVESLEDVRLLVHYMTTHHCIILGRTKDGVEGSARRLLKPKDELEKRII